MQPARSAALRGLLWLTCLVAAALPLELVLSEGVASADPVSTVMADLATGLALDPTLDRSTPRRALASFLDEARDGHFVTASHCLDLRGEPDLRGGPGLAEELSYVLYRRPPLDLTRVPDDPTAGAGNFVVETFAVDDRDVPLSLSRVRFDDGVFRWVISEMTVAHIPDIAATLRTAAWQQRLPRSLRSPVILGNAPWQWIGLIVSLLIAYAVGRFFAFLATVVGRRFARSTVTPVDDLLVESARRPLRTICASIVFALLVYALELSLEVAKLAGHLAYSAFIVGLAWLLLAIFDLFARVLTPDVPDFDSEASDTAGRRTRRALLQRVASAGVIGVTAALLLLQFDVVRHVGLSLLASAGIAGVVLGFAGQKSISGLIAGIQLSITQPVRLGDIILLDGEAGVVRDIFLTYAVIRFADDRCLVVPLTRFLEQPFQNWTLHNRQITGTILLPVRFSAPVGGLRDKLREVCEANPRWDKRRCDIVVSDSDHSGMTLRMHVSSRTVTESSELLCEVREKMIAHLLALDGGKHLG
jgi:small-conductance mechanosensitive channel